MLTCTRRKIWVTNYSWLNVSFSLFLFSWSYLDSRLILVLMMIVFLFRGAHTRGWIAGIRVRWSIKGWWILFGEIQVVCLYTGYRGWWITRHDLAVYSSSDAKHTDTLTLWTRLGEREQAEFVFGSLYPGKDAGKFPRDKWVYTR